MLIRRKAKENNFKAVLSTIRDLMNTSAVGRAVPTWMQDIFLGYGDPAVAFNSVFVWIRLTTTAICRHVEY